MGKNGRGIQHNPHDLELKTLIFHQWIEKEKLEMRLQNKMKEPCDEKTFTCLKKRDCKEKLANIAASYNRDLGEYFSLYSDQDDGDNYFVLEQLHTDCEEVVLCNFCKAEHESIQERLENEKRENREEKDAK
jgi:hypothetical protein